MEVVAGLGAVDAAGFEAAAEFGADDGLGAAEDFGVVDELAGLVVLTDSGIFSVSISDEVTAEGGKIFSSVPDLISLSISDTSADFSEVSAGSAALFTGSPTGSETLRVSLSVTLPVLLPFCINKITAATATTTAAAAIIGTSFFDYFCETGTRDMFLGALQFLQNCSSSNIF